MILESFNIEEMCHHKGFHGTTNESAKKILENGFNKPKYKDHDNHWLGHGTYFYDDIDKARYWATHKTAYIRREHQSWWLTPAVISSDIINNINDVLDLDKIKQFNDFIRYFDESDSALFASGYSVVFDEGTPKQLRCAVLDLYAETKGYKLIKYTFCINDYRPGYARGIKHRSTLEKLDLKIQELQLCLRDCTTAINLTMV